mmetsp:Transcript_15639/g.28847  ORF Transcript_15639/g.28847 Transcript_15639/m.28847 type:complete len:230 (+) Transcript_15639:172-861(+)
MEGRLLKHICHIPTAAATGFIVTTFHFTANCPRRPVDVRKKRVALGLEDGNRLLDDVSGFQPGPDALHLKNVVVVGPPEPHFICPPVQTNALSAHGAVSRPRHHRLLPNPNFTGTAICCAFLPLSTLFTACPTHTQVFNVKHFHRAHLNKGLGVFGREARSDVHARQQAVGRSRNGRELGVVLGHAFLAVGFQFYALAGPKFGEQNVFVSGPHALHPKPLLLVSLGHPL